MTDDRGGVQIIRCYELWTAPTGEGTRYDCADGTVWRDCQPFERAEGEIHAGYVFPLFKGGDA